MRTRHPKRSVVVLVGFAVLATALGAGHAQAQTTFLGEIILVPYTFCPNGFAETDGSLLPINQNQALFSLIGTTFGGDGVQTFALPDLRGRVPIDQGQGPGLTGRILGETGGEEAHMLTVNEMPAHTHSFGLGASTAIATDAQPSPLRVLSTSALGDRQFTSAAPNTTLAAGTTGAAGGGQPHNNMQPYLVMRYCIALVGVFPSRP
jgi:microcystin-dependent protein